VAMPWLGKVKAVLQMWWPGDEGGWATANVLAGRKNPAGRLPFTWAQRLTDYAAGDPAHPERAGNDPNGKASFSEGIDVGYRWFDRLGTVPRYPFGFGLSYTRFVYSGLKISADRDGGLDVRFVVRNAGSADGEEIAQIYLSPPRQAPKGVPFAVKTLAGFDRIFLKMGAAREVIIHVDRRRTQYWSVAQNRWLDAAATRTVFVAASSRDVRLQAAVPAKRAGMRAHH
jgi:beta-glucosidase